MKLLALRENVQLAYENLKIDKPLFYKITLVAISVFTFFSLQWPCSHTFKVNLTLFAILSTYIFEKTSSGEYSKNWLKNSFSTACKVTLVVLLYYLSDLLHLGLLPLETSGLFLQKIAEQIANYDLKMMTLSCLIAPITEEVLFRGYIEERVLDLLSLVSKHIVTMSLHMQEEIARLLSSSLFGFLHITDSQTQGIKNKIVVFLDVAKFGYLNSLIKKSHDQLITPIFTHCLNNVSCTLRILKRS
jgi:membrane protease YdiL (CAAX protease family)